MANSIFKISNKAFIRLVYLNILTKSFLFNMMYINISILIYLANMNKFNTFLVNIINQIIWL